MRSARQGGARGLSQGGGSSSQDIWPGAPRYSAATGNDVVLFTSRD